jgi:hypothetical protein
MRRRYFHRFAIISRHYFFCLTPYFDIAYATPPMPIFHYCHAATPPFSIFIDDAFDADFHAIIAGIFAASPFIFTLLRFHAMIFLLILLCRCFRCHC